jgi:cysteine desulfurase
MNNRLIYFDHNATTPLDPQVREAMLPWLGESFGNPSSSHRLGRVARAALDEAHETVAQLFACKPSEITFTSGGTESNNLAVLGTARRLRAQGRHLITTAIEHPAVLECFRHLEAQEGFEVTYVRPDQAGYVSPDSIINAARPDTVFVSVMALNNEVGTIQPVAEIGRFCRERGILFHTDAVQWFGKEPFVDIHHFQADMVSVCAHKFYGPTGAGLLYIRSPFQPMPVMLGGAQENERRAGTENLATIMGLVKALTLFLKDPGLDAGKIRNLSSQLEDCLRGSSGVKVLRSGRTTANTVSFVVKDSDSAAMLAALDLEGVCASSGSACTSGALLPSHVVLAMGGTEAEAKALVRFSLGRGNTQAEVDHVTQLLPRLVARVAQNQQPPE